MVWPDSAESLAWLNTQGPAESMARLLRACGDRPQDVLALLSSGAGAEKWVQSWSQLPQQLARGQAGLLAEVTPPQAVAILQKICHDLMVQAVGGVPRFFETTDLPKQPQPEASLMALAVWARELNQSAQTADHAFNPGLMLEALVSRAQTAIQT
jgi:DNA polymerase-3 subunit delta'